MTNNYFAAIVKGIGNYCNVLHNDGRFATEHLYSPLGITPSGAASWKERSPAPPYSS
jgi:hypothetical protein